MNGQTPNTSIVRESVIVPLAKIIVITLIFIIFDYLFIYLGLMLWFFITEIVHFSFIAYIILRWFMDYYEIGIEELIIKKGILFTDKQVYPLKNIESVDLKQGLIGKIFKLGDITLYLPKLRKTVNMYWIARPNHYLELLQNSLHEEEQWTGNY